MSQLDRPPEIFFIAADLPHGPNNVADVLMDRLADRGIKLLNPLGESSKDENEVLINASDAVVAEVTEANTLVGEQLEYAIRHAGKLALLLANRSNVNPFGQKMMRSFEDMPHVRAVRYTGVVVAKSATDVFLESRLGYRVPSSKLRHYEAK